MALLNVTDVDRRFYEENLKDFLPHKILDCHTHIWLKEFDHGEDTAHRSCLWPGMVAQENPIEDLVESYKLMFPDKEVIPCLFSNAKVTLNLEENNPYVREKSAQYGYPALYLAHPSEPAEQVERRVLEGGFRGLKVYLEYAPSYIPNAEIRVFDFLTHEHLKVADKYGWAVMLHIPRPKRLADPVNYMQIMEIEEKYPNVKLIIAHLGRAYAPTDVGDALDVLKHTKKMMWDFTANTCEEVMERCLETFGVDRFIFGSDLPIFRMKARRIVENGFYINLVPKGSLGDVSTDPHMREVEGKEAEEISFFLYDELLSCKRACEKLGLGKSDVEKIFYSNAARVYGVK